MIKKAVIVAAGLSSRLYPLTLERPKGLLPVGNEALLVRSVNLLKENGITDISLVVGYKYEMIREALGNQVNYIANPFYQHCNNMGSLWFAKQAVGDEPFVYLHGDIIYHKEILASVLQGFQTRSNDIELVTDFKDNDEEAMKVLVDSNNYLLESNKEIPLDKAQGEWIGIALIRNSKALFASMEDIMFNQGLNYYDTHSFTALAQNRSKVYCSPTNGLPWVEVDFLEDYERAKVLFDETV